MLTISSENIDQLVHFRWLNVNNSNRLHRTSADTERQDVDVLY